MLMRRWALAALTLVSLAILSATPARAADPDKYFPDGTNMVVQVNLNQMLGSTLLHKGIPLASQKYGDAVLKMLVERIPDENARGMIEQIGPQFLANISEETVTGFMMMGKQNVQDFVFAVNSAKESNNTPQVIMMLRSARLEPSLMEQFAGMIQMNPQAELKEEKVGDVTVYEIKMQQQPQPFSFCIPEDGIMVMSPFKNILIEAIKKKGQGKLDPKFKELLGQRKASYTVFAAGLAPKEKQNEFKHFVGTLTLDKDVKGNLIVECKDADTAQEQVKKANDELEGMLGKLKEFANRHGELKPLADSLKAVKAEADGSTVKANLNIKGDELLKAVREAK